MNRSVAEITDLTTISDKEVWAIAGDLIERFGDIAAVEASKRADECGAKGNLAGRLAWLRIVRSITAMTDPEPCGLPN